MSYLLQPILEYSLFYQHDGNNYQRFPKKDKSTESKEYGSNICDGETFECEENVGLELKKRKKISPILIRQNQVGDNA